eukprot:TRINITY_DN4780_c0_g1_i1.p1 TRINITY_DN4780_c0_g1~~TRINITY_DN4780_c0_g1_i1.p1  ORF type:complete len:453 (-),score=48.53 TRINITY_DN4780_c0_g1_i1:324-1682(-)
MFFDDSSTEAGSCAGAVAKKVAGPPKKPAPAPPNRSPNRSVVGVAAVPEKPAAAGGYAPRSQVLSDFPRHLHDPTCDLPVPGCGVMSYAEAHRFDAPTDAVVEDFSAHKPQFCVGTHGISCRDALRAVDPAPCASGDYCGAPVYPIPPGHTLNNWRRDPFGQKEATGKHHAKRRHGDKVGVLAWTAPPRHAGKGKLHYGGTFLMGWTAHDPPRPAAPPLAQGVAMCPITGVVTRCPERLVPEPCRLASDSSGDANAKQPMYAPAVAGYGPPYGVGPAVMAKQSAPLPPASDRTSDSGATHVGRDHAPLVHGVPPRAISRQGSMVEMPPPATGSPRVPAFGLGAGGGLGGVPPPSTGRFGPQSTGPRRPSVGQPRSPSPGLVMMPPPRSGSGVSPPPFPRTGSGIGLRSSSPAMPPPSMPSAPGIPARQAAGVADELEAMQKFVFPAPPDAPP